MSDAVVDTNVLGSANATDSGRLECAASCALALQTLAASGRVVIDQGWEILNEYSRIASPRGQPGPGDAFLRWVLTNQANPSRCLQVRIRPHNDRGYEEFPPCEHLEGFDANDRKFVAVAVTAGPDIEIFVALDRGWWTFRNVLRDCGLRIRYLCEDQLREIAEGRG
jgi:hypothetical protein